MMFCSENTLKCIRITKHFLVCLKTFLTMHILGPKPLRLKVTNRFTMLLILDQNCEMFKVSFTVDPDVICTIGIELETMEQNIRQNMFNHRIDCVNTVSTFQSKLCTKLQTYWVFDQTGWLWLLDRRHTTIFFRNTW